MKKIDNELLLFIKQRKCYKLIFYPEVKEVYKDKVKYQYRTANPSKYYWDDNKKPLCISPKVMSEGFNIESFDIDIDGILDKKCDLMFYFHKAKDKITYVHSAKGRIKFWIKLEEYDKEFYNKYDYEDGVIEVISNKACDYGINTDPDNNWYSNVYNWTNLKIDRSNDKDVLELLEFIRGLTPSNQGSITRCGKNKVISTYKSLEMLSMDKSKEWIDVLRNPERLYAMNKHKYPLGDGLTYDNGSRYKTFYLINQLANEDDWNNFVKYITDNVYEHFEYNLYIKGLLKWKR